MTYRQIMQELHPDKCGPDYIGGCAGCPGDILNGAPKEDGEGCLYDKRIDNDLCRKCWDSAVGKRKKKKA